MEASKKIRKVIAYTRVSTDEQSSTGVSLEMQEGKIRQWAALNDKDYAEVHLFSDPGISGTIPYGKRPGLAEALACARKGDALVVYSLSRLTRSTADAISLSLMLDRKGVDLVSITEKIDTTSAAGKMMFRMMAVLSEFERDVISERTKAALQYKKKTGKVYNHPPYGYDREGTDLVKNDMEQAIKERIAGEYRGCCNFNAVARKVNTDGIKTRCGGRWTAQQVKNVVEGRA